LGAVLGYAASPMLPLTGSPFVFAFAGSLAAAMADTLSSEIGGLFDTPRLITTLEPVPPGTDGGVTWQGVVAGLFGSLLIAVLGFLFLPISPAGAIAVALAGIAGMVVDSLLGARFENRAVGELFAG